ncbi:MAG: zf-TFIIB domain-containing protein [Bacillota bacterium]
MYCPKCEAPMRQAKKEGVIIDVCPSCRGVWLDSGELEKIMHEAQHEMAEYEELYKHYDKHSDKHKHYDHHHGYKKKKHGVYSILKDIFD